jgi:hypothetical protein
MTPHPDSSPLLPWAAAAREAEVRAPVDIEGVQPESRESLIAADPDHGDGGVDAVAGSEFVDDRIRLRE